MNKIYTTIFQLYYENIKRAEYFKRIEITKSEIPLLEKSIIEQFNQEPNNKYSQINRVHISTTENPNMFKKEDI